MERKRRRTNGKYISHFAKKVEPMISKVIRNHTVLRIRNSTPKVKINE